MQSLMVSALISGASGHGWMTAPLSRASLHCPDYELNPYYCISHQGITNGACPLEPCGECDPPDSSGGGGNCSAGVYPGVATPPEPYCNPNQMPNTTFLETPGEVQAHYTAGDIVEVSWVVSVNHRGWYQYRLCLDGSDTEECFKQTQLRFADGELWHNLPSPCTTCTGFAPDHGTMVPLMVDRVVIPSGVQCDRCTLSWRWDALEESTIFTGCADVSVSLSPAPTPSPPPTPPTGGGCCRFGASCGDCGDDGSGWCHLSASNCAVCTGIFDTSGSAPSCGGGGAPSPSPSPSPSPTPPTNGGQCCYGGGCSSCNGAGEWCSSSASACEGSCGGTYCSQRSSLTSKTSFRQVTKHE